MHSKGLIYRIYRHIYRLSAHVTFKRIFLESEKTAKGSNPQIADSSNAAMGHRRQKCYDHGSANVAHVSLSVVATDPLYYIVRLTTTCNDVPPTVAAGCSCIVRRAVVKRTSASRSPTLLLPTLCQRTGRAASAAAASGSVQLKHTIQRQSHIRVRR